MQAREGEMQAKVERQMISVALFLVNSFSLLVPGAARACQTFDEVGITTCVTLFSSANVSLRDKK